MGGSTKKAVENVKKTTAKAVNKAKENAQGIATDVKAEGVRAVDAGKEALHVAADQGKQFMIKTGIAKGDEPDDTDSTATTSPGESRSVGKEAGGNVMRQAVSSKGKIAKRGATGKRALRKVGATV